MEFGGRRLEFILSKVYDGSHPFHWGEVFKETEPYNRGTKVARYYLAQTSADQVIFAVNPQIGAPEHHEHRWLSSSEIVALAPVRLLPVLQWVRRLVER